MEQVYFLNEQAFRSNVETLFQEQKRRIHTLLPAADIQHIGSTAIPNSLTKGDLDIQVRVASKLFPDAVKRLSKVYELNDGSDQNDEFAAFKDDSTKPPLGIQLSVIGSDYDFFWKVRDVLLQNDTLREQYDALKAQYEGKNMDDYREAKCRFIEELMDTDDFRRL